MVQDDAILDLAERLREMVGVANECQDLPMIDGTTNVIEAIGRMALQVASLIDEYTHLPFLGMLVILGLVCELIVAVYHCTRTNIEKSDIWRYEESYYPMPEILR
jgi:hypothetical protein